MDTNLLMLSMVLGSIGMGMFVYGKKQQRYVHLGAGIALMVCPYFIPSVLALCVVGVLLTVVPFLLG